MRWKLIAGNVAAVLLAGLLAWVMVRSKAADALSRDIDASVQRGVGLFSAVRTAEADRLRGLTVDGSQRQQLQAVFALSTVSEQSTAAAAFANALANELSAEYPT